MCKMLGWLIEKSIVWRIFLMRIIIAGGTGMIGKSLAGRLASQQHEVFILGRREPSAGVLPMGVQFQKWDGVSAKGWGHMVDGTSAIVNLAGENLSAGRWTENRKQRILQSRIHAGKAIVEALQDAENKPAVLIQISGIGAYGTSETVLFDENSPYGSDFLSNVTVEWEKSTQPVEDMGVRRVEARMAVVLDKHGGALPRLVLPFKLFGGGPLGSGRQWLSWVHHLDAVRALQFLMEDQTAHGVYNISAESITNRDFARILGEVLKRPAIIPVPSIAIRMLFGEMGTMILEGQRATSKRLQDSGFTFQFPTAQSALKELVGRD
jgi:hypothetical protein